MALTNVTKNEMLRGLVTTLTDIQLKFQDGTTNTAFTETSLWNSTLTNGVLNQDENVVFEIDTSGGAKNITGFNLIFTDNNEIGVTVNFQQIYQYPNNGTFTFDGTTIVVE